MPLLIVCLSLTTILSPKSSVEQWTPLLQHISREYCLDPHLLAALMWHESHGDPGAVSSVGAIGLFQIMPANNFVRPEYSFDWRPDPTYLFVPSNNAHYAARILRQLFNRTGDVRESLALYNCGEVRLYADTCGKGQGWEYADNILQTWRKWKPVEPVSSEMICPPSGEYSFC